MIARRAIMATLALTTIWSMTWFFLTKLTARAIDAWISREQSAGRNWACGDISLSGYPFWIEYRCGSLSLTFSDGSRARSARLGSAMARARLLNPESIEIILDGPLSLDFPDQKLVGEISWNTAQVSLPGIWSGKHAASIELRDVALRAASAANQEFTTRADQLRFEITRRSEKSATLSNFDVSLTATNILSSQIELLTGESAPSNFSLQSKIAGVPAPSGSPIATLEKWRAAGGSLDIANARFDVASLSLDGSGILQLDRLHRLEGYVQINAVNGAPILKRFGVPDAALAIGGMLGGFLSKRTRDAGRSEAAIPIPLNFREGRVFKGAFPAPVRLLPLY